ncbi:sterol carrier family protein [Herbiconiux sp. SYSU D00978]|uniref:sterol carrier family protein n=1 Tax=Herbiconiux sp. SYSU D00978 TaxID=2812562 RepID=UPI001A9750CF|nr:sterol carrier family protein [Herbiconiux sp. SYSU D00978]
MARPRIDPAAGAVAVQAVLDADASRDTTALAVRYLLQVLSDEAPGNTVEVRVPPFGAVQVVEGPRHTRGTPPNVVETDPTTWVEIATGTALWSEALLAGRISASGSRSDLGALLPLKWRA